MLKIGDFSKLAKVTVKTLRLYAEMGLLLPAWTDRFTGYRYYTLDQLPRLNRILALKELGLSLEQIRQVLESNLSTDELRGMFYLKQAEIQQRLMEEQLRLSRIEARLKQIEQEGALDVEAVVVRAIDPLPVAFTRVVAPSPDDLPAVHARARQAILLTLERHQLQAAEPWLAINPGGEYQEHDIALEVAVAIDQLPRVPPSSGPVMLRTLPALPLAAVYAHPGAPEDLPQAYRTLYSWAEANHYRICGPVREVYWSDDQAAPGDDYDLDHLHPPIPRGGQIIEIQLPVEPIALNKETPMEPEIIEHREILVTGVVYTGSNENYEIAKMWQHEFLPRIDEIRRVDNYVSYGVCVMDESVPHGQIRYTAAVEIARTEDAPPGMAVTRVPAGKYAVFKHIGSLEGLWKANEYIYQVWLPNSGFKRANRPDLEVYTNEFNDFSPDSVLYLYVPVE